MCVCVKQWRPCGHAGEDNVVDEARVRVVPKRIFSSVVYRNSKPKMWHSVALCHGVFLTVGVTNMLFTSVIGTIDACALCASH